MHTHFSFCVEVGTIGWAGGAPYCLAAIRAFATAISPVGLNTPPRSPYFAIAQYGLRRALSPLAIRAFATAISPVGLNSPPRSPGVALCLPRAVFWRPFRALVVWTIGNPGFRFAYPGLCSGAPSGLMFRKPLRGYCGLGALLPPALPGATRGNPYGVYNIPSPFGVSLCLPRAVFWRPGVSLCLPRAVFWRPFRALLVWTIGNPTPLIGEYVEFDGE